MSSQTQLPLNVRLIRFAFDLYPFLNGQGRIIEKTSLNKIRFKTSPVTVRSREGFEMTVLPNDLLGRHVVLTGRFDPTIGRLMASRMKDDDYVFDIGASVGDVSCVLLHMKKACRVVAVEPLPMCYELMEKNTKGLAADRVTCVEAAVSNESGTGVLVLDQQNFGATRLAEETGEQTDDDSVFHVPMVTGEELMERGGFPTVHAIKIDVEGHELPVLESLLPILTTHRPHTVIFECHGRMEPDHPILALFKDIDYEVLGIQKTLTKWKLRPLEALGDYTSVPNDYLAQPIPA